MPKFTVIRASAGSGKTFSLTQEYLRLILTRPDNFKHILAVTFTNKATEEMKSRIIRELFLLSSGKESMQLYPLTISTGLDENEIRRRSEHILRRLLHQYSWFSVNTIDTFFQRIIRNFTRELGIQEGYVIELDTEPVLTEVIDRLLVNAENDSTLLDWLSVFAESLIEKGENWNLKKSIRKLGNEIFREEFKNLDTESISRLCDRDFMKGYRDGLYALRRQKENILKEFGVKALNTIKGHGLSLDDFNLKSRGPAGYFEKIANGEFEGPSEAVCEAIVRKEKWFTKTSHLRNSIEKLAVDDLMPLLRDARQFYDENNIHVNSASVILKNLYTLGILIDLSRLSDNWCSENNTFLLPEAPVFLNRIIDGNDTPFIYEKAGCWFHHFMIDEFQDTSIMQWNNFKPLISNSLSQNFDNLAVGDVKQSIYRWRNSNWEILETNIAKDFLPGIIKPVSLAENRRSREILVNFNNDFFNEAAKLLQEEFSNMMLEKNVPENLNLRPLTELYRDMKQIPARKDSIGGYVKVQFVENSDETDFYETVNNQVADIIYGLLVKGYKLKDIAVLTRKNKEAAELADFLLNYSGEGRHPLKVISDEALHLESSVVLNTLISLLKYIDDPTDRNNTYYLTSVSSNYIYGKAGVSWITPRFKPDRQPELKLPGEFHELVKGARSFSLVEITERLITMFRLDVHEGEMVYLMAFRDLIQEYIRNHSSNITRFLEFWEEIGSQRSVAAPAGQDALRILTLHKAKGLEFKVAIIPYCTWEFNTFDRSFIWCRPEQEPFRQLSVLPINFTKKLARTIFAHDYYQELHKQLVDNLNLMYVAFTRARDAMFIFCREIKNDGSGNASTLMKSILRDRIEPGDSSFESGVLTPVQTENENVIFDFLNYRHSEVSAVSPRLKIAFQGNIVLDPETDKPSRPLNEGRILHEIFNLIRTRDDIKTAVSIIHLQGKISTSEQNKYIRFIENAMNDLQVSTWFAGDWEILTESEIIIPGGDIRRPDRVMQQKGQTLVIDYKFGLTPDGSHDTQLKEYADILRTMGYVGIEAYLWYVRLGRVMQVSLREA